MPPRSSLGNYYETLHSHFGPSEWWPGDSPFEIAVGAILTQNTAWVNVERAIGNLKRANLLSPRDILASPPETLEDALRPSGYFRIKAKRLRHFCEYLVTEHDGSMRRMAQTPLERLRPELLRIHGIGPETADDILLYACAHPVFVVDAYTRRIFSRHGVVAHGIAYEPLREYFEKRLPADVALFKEFHAQIVFTGRDYCKPTPRCEHCPLRKHLPKHGPLLA